MSRRGASSNKKNDVFVGNIAYGTTQEQLEQIFSQVGKVMNIRNVIDPDTGKSKGYAFVEYNDASEALSAIRNLNGYDVNGRQLRVNYSSNSSLSGSGGGSSSSSGRTNTVKSVVDNMNMHEIYDIVAAMKEFVEQDEAQAKQLLTEHSQVAEALFIMQMRLGMAKSGDIQMKTRERAGDQGQSASRRQSQGGAQAPAGDRQMQMQMQQQQPPQQQQPQQHRQPGASAQPSNFQYDRQHQQQQHQPPPQQQYYDQRQPESHYQQAQGGRQYQQDYRPPSPTFQGHYGQGQGGYPAVNQPMDVGYNQGYMQQQQQPLVQGQAAQPMYDNQAQGRSWPTQDPRDPRDPRAGRNY